ncbi:hypothetical protein EC991_008006 [Linnemannia zychae]|nr:hypothetical protein EC991_008006 [Linnemannia zychae]
MSRFTIETVLDTKESGVIELFEDAPAGDQKVSGTLHLHVDKAIHLKELSVVFSCEAVVGFSSAYVSASSEPVTMYKNQFDAVPTTSTPTEFLPGAYTFPFQITIPSDLSTTDSTKLISQEFSWSYRLTTTAVPTSSGKGVALTSLFQKRKTIQQLLTLRRVYPNPSGGSSVRSLAGRKGEREEDGEIKVAIFVPQVVNVKQTIVPVTVQLMALRGRGGDEKRKSKFWVKEIQAQGIQTEKITHNSSEVFHSLVGLRDKIPMGVVADPHTQRMFRNAKQHPQQQLSLDNPDVSFAGLGGTPSMIDTVNTKLISNLVTIEHPNQFHEGLQSSSEDYSQTFELNLTAGKKNGDGGKEVLPSETLPWIEVRHAIKLRVLFENESGVKPLLVRVPLKVAHVYEGKSVNRAVREPVFSALNQAAEETDDWVFGETVPGYDFEAGDDQRAGREEDSLPSYGEDMNRSRLLDSTAQSLLVK